MDCPVCKEALIVLEYDAVEVDYCVRCEGIWLDVGELEILFGDAEACAAFLSIGSPADAKGEKPRRCPICRVKMTKEATESAPPILFDHCPKGDGLWLDKGELAQVLGQSKAAEGMEDVSVFLRAVFSQDDVSTQEGGK